MITEAGVVLMEVIEAKLEDDEPRTLLKDTGFEDQCAKLNGHPSKMLLLRGENCEEVIRTALGEGEGSLKEKFRNDCEPGCLLVCGPGQMLPLAKKYFYTSLNDAITANEIKWATKCLVIFPVNPESNEELIAKMKSFEMELVEMEETTLSEEQVQMLVETVENTEETEIEDLKAQLLKPTLLFAYRNLGGDIDEEMFKNIEELEVEPLVTTKSDEIIWAIFPEFGNKKEEEMQEDPPVEEMQEDP